MWYNGGVNASVVKNYGPFQAQGTTKMFQEQEGKLAVRQRQYVHYSQECS